MDRSQIPLLATDCENCKVTGPVYQGWCCPNKEPGKPCKAYPGKRTEEPGVQ